MKLVRYAITLLLPVVCVCSVNAQDERSTVFLSGVRNGTLDRPVEDAFSAIEINAQGDSSKAFIKLGSSFSSPHPSPGASTFSTLTLKASAPINKSSDKTDLGTLDGLVNAFTLQLKFTEFIVTGRKGAEVVNDPGNAALLKQIESQMRDGCIKKGDCENQEAASKLLVDTNNVKIYAPNRYYEFKSLFWDPEGWKLSAGIEGTFGYESFEFLKAMSLEKDNESKIPWSAKGFVGIIPPHTRLLVSIGAEYQKTFKDAKEMTLCGPPNQNGLQSCKTDSVGPPVNDDKLLTFVEGRTSFRISEGFRPIGLSLKLTYDTKNKIFGADLPIYLLTDKDGGLTGGVRLGFRDDTDRVTLGVFVGATFSIF